MAMFEPRLRARWLAVSQPETSHASHRANEIPRCIVARRARGLGRVGRGGCRGPSATRSKGQMCQMACEQCKTCGQPTAWARGVTRRAMYLSVRGVWGGTDGPRWAADVSPSPRLLARPRNPAPSGVTPRGRQKRGSSPRHSPRRGVHEVELDFCGVKHGNELASAEPG
jgi:hypothetical protein